MQTTFPSVASTSDVIAELICQYEETGTEIAVDFRELVPGIANPDRATHLIHPYPAKLLLHIPIFFLANDYLSKPGDTIVDPFCGSGTVLLESILMSRNAVGADINPLAALISRVKTSPVDAATLTTAYECAMDNCPSAPTTEAPDVVNIDYWFGPAIRDQLMCLLEGIRCLEDERVREFFLLCFSNCVRRVSYADPRVSVPVRLRRGQYPVGHKLREKTDRRIDELADVDVKAQFAGVVRENMRRMRALAEITDWGSSAVVLNRDVRDLVAGTFEAGDGINSIRPESAQLIITSPPYAGSQKYMRSSSLQLGWLGLCRTSEVRQYESCIIGRDHYRKSEYIEPCVTGLPGADRVIDDVRKGNALRAHIAAIYLKEMGHAFRSIVRALSPGGHLVLVVGNNHVCGREFDSRRFLSTVLCELGMKLRLALADNIRSRGLMTKRNKTADMIAKEYVLLFQKPQ